MSRSLDATPDAGAATRTPSKGTSMADRNVTFNFSDGAPSITFPIIFGWIEQKYG